MREPNDHRPPVATHFIVLRRGILTVSRHVFKGERVYGYSANPTTAAARAGFIARKEGLRYVPS